MNISKLNPIGYEAKTSKGNTYKKSNIGKSSFLALGVASTLGTHMSKNPLVNSLSETSLVKSLGIKNPKLATAATVGLITVGLVADFIIGSLIDKGINKKRAAKADAQV